MDPINILLVEDESTLAMIIKDTLEGQGFRIRLAKDGEEGLQSFFREKPDVLVADVMMPRMDGFEMVRNDVVEGFELGANDYLKKPFGMQELIVRIKALLGRAIRTEDSPTRQTVYEIGTYVFTPRTQRLLHNGTETELSHRESEILRRLCEQQDQVVDMHAVLLDLWGDDTFFNQRSLHVFITKLRHKLSKDGRIRIVNVRGIGYKLIVG